MKLLEALLALFLPTSKKNNASFNFTATSLHGHLCKSLVLVTQKTQCLDPEDGRGKKTTKSFDGLAVKCLGPLFFCSTCFLLFVPLLV